MSRHDWMKIDGEVKYFEFPSPAERKAECWRVQSHATKYDAKVTFESIDGFKCVSHEPIYIVRITVIEPARELKSRGRPKNA